MGFLDKLKSVKNFVTGGGAEVVVLVDNPSLTDPFMVTVQVTVKDADIKVNKVYLKIQSVEEVMVPDVPVAVEEDEGGGMRRVRVERKDFRHETITYSHEYDIAGPQEFPANSEQEITAEISLPQGAIPTFQGRNARHIWQIYAGLDMFGNDPDSGWVTFEVWD